MQAKAAARPVTGPAVVLLSSRTEKRQPAPRLGPWLRLPDTGSVTAGGGSTHHRKGDPDMGSAVTVPVGSWSRARLGQGR